MNTGKTGFVERVSKAESSSDRSIDRECLFERITKVIS